MRKRWFVRGVLACAAFLGSVHLAQAQTSGSSMSSSGLGASSSSGSSGIGTLTGAAGASGQGIASLGTTGTSSGAYGGGGRGGGSGASTTVVPQVSDPLQSTYANPLAIGVSGVSTSFTTTSSGGITQSSASAGQAFGLPTFATTTTTSNRATTGASTTTINTGGFSTLNMLKNHPYATVLGKNVPIVNLPPVQLQSELLNSLQQSTFLTNKAGVLLKVDGSTVYLKGQVANEDERRIVEGFVRMTPGVRNVVNELVAPVELSSNQ
jgi:hypothetical protein